MAVATTEWICELCGRNEDNPDMAPERAGKKLCENCFHNTVSCFVCGGLLSYEEAEFLPSMDPASEVVHHTMDLWCPACRTLHGVRGIPHADYFKALERTNPLR